MVGRACGGRVGGGGGGRGDGGEMYGERASE